MAGYIGTQAVSVNTTSATISDDLAVGDDLTVTDDATIGGTALVTGVLTTTAATVFNGGFASNANSTMGTDKKLIFRDSAIHISSTADGDMSIAADDEIDITSTLIDINGNVEISGTIDATTSASDAYFFRSSHATTTSFYITNTNSTTNNVANLLLCPANNVAGAYLSAIATEDFSTSANRTADLAFYTRKDGTFSEQLRIDSSGQLHTTAGIAGANTHMATGFVADKGVVYSRGLVSAGARSNNNGYLSGFAIVNGDNSSNGGGSATGRIVANIGGMVVTDDNNAGDDSGGDMTFHTKPNGGNLAERIRIDSLGTTTFASEPHAPSFRATDFIDIRNDDAELYFTNAANNRYARFRRDNTHNDIDLAFFNGSSTTNKFKFRAGGDLQIAAGNLVVGTAGKGIDFSAQTASSASGSSTTAEILDHYEEGTWTPTIAAGGGSISGTASYTRIGRMVYVTGDLTLAGSRNSSAFRIGGLPYTVNRWQPGSFYAQSYTREGTDQVTASASGGSSNIAFVAFGDEASGNEFGNGYFVVSIWYHVD